jgi:hypothetical protein
MDPAADSLRIGDGDIVRTPIQSEIRELLDEPNAGRAVSIREVMGITSRLGLLEATVQTLDGKIEKLSDEQFGDGQRARDVRGTVVC